MQNDPSNPSATVSRRQFLKSSSMAAASAAAVVSFPAVLSAQANMKFNAIIIGVGGRGSDAGKNFLDGSKQAGVESKIVAIADIFPEQAAKAGKYFEVPADKCFSGFDGCGRRWKFQRQLRLLATARIPRVAPRLRRGGQIFSAKPVAVDGPA
jgi:hypothetical protein